MAEPDPQGSETLQDLDQELKVMDPDPELNFNVVNVIQKCSNLIIIIRIFLRVK
jgi:hypothetical protein